MPADSDETPQNSACSVRAACSYSLTSYQQDIVSLCVQALCFMLHLALPFTKYTMHLDTCKLNLRAMQAPSSGQYTCRLNLIALQAPRSSNEFSTGTHLLTTCMGHQQRLLLSSRAWLRCVNWSCFLKARSVSSPCRLSLKLPKMGDSARLSRRFSSLEVAI